jgi:antitoxin VapB
MQRTAKIFMNNRSQAVRLPKEFQFSTSEVFIRRQGEDVILSARPTDWSAYLASGPVASKEFMEGSTSCRSKSANSDGRVHARYGYIVLHHEAFS